MSEARVLGQLLLMQSISIGLPDENAIFRFVCRGLLDLPGVTGARYAAIGPEKEEAATTRFALQVGEASRGELLLTVEDPKAFAPYAHYLENFCFMLAVILEERSQRRQNDLLQSRLEVRVQERTRELEEQIAERRSVERSLRESEASFRSIFDRTATGYVLTSPDGRLLKVNAAMAGMLGYAVDELTLVDFRSITHPDDISISNDCVRSLLAGERETCQFEKRYLHRAGTTVWAVVNTTLLRDRNAVPLYFITSVTDITNRKRVEEALLQSEERHRAILQTAMDGFWLVDTEGHLLEVNETYCRMSGYSAEELRRMSITDLEAAETADDTADHLQKIMAHGEDRFESRHRRRDGSLYDVEISVQFRPVHGGGLVTFIRDVTERKFLAEERARLEDQLRQAQRIEAIGRLAGGVAHDFNNLTAIVLGYGEMLLGQLPPEDPARRSAEQIVEAGRRSAALTSQLLAFSRRQVLQPVVLDLNGLLRNLEKMLGRLIGEDIELRLDLTADPGRITADPGQIEQVVTNLVINARDAMPHGGRLSVETADVELDETFAREHEGAVPGWYVLFALTDTGSGMNEATMARLFEPFFTTKERSKGTGLGLATAFGIVKQSGGYIHACSEAGKGSTFKVYLPRTEAKTEPQAAEAAGDAAPRGSGELILLVEDEAALRELCEVTLSQLGYQVSTAGNGQEALVLLQEQGLEPALVLTDVIMPGMSGAEMVARLRKGRPDVRALYMSGYHDETIAHHGVLDPGTLFLQKPFTERALAAKVREALTGKTAVAQPARRRVLMIDDDEQFCELVQHFCAKRGHVFAAADSSAGALAALARQPFDVLLVDLNIPGTDGGRVLREIRAAGHAAPAIVLTGDVASADMEALRALGAVCALEKSSRAEPLMRAIEEASSTPRRAPTVIR